jgi:cytochrome c oxidase subunit 2
MTRRVAIATMASLALALGLGACGNLGMPHPVTTQAEDTRDLWRIFVIFAIVIGAIVYALVVFVLVRYRRRRQDDGTAPDQRQYHIPIEIFYTALPLVIVGVLLGLSIRAENHVTKLSSKPDVTIDVVGFQWQWQFRYEGSTKLVTGTPGSVPTLVLPTDRTIRLKLSSPDVIHSFWVPHFLEKRDLIPGVDNQIDVRVNEPGQWNGLCSEFCGVSHTTMVFTVKAMAPADFQAWLTSGGSS